MKAREKKAVKKLQNGTECPEQPTVNMTSGYRAGKNEMHSNLSEIQNSSLVPT